MTGDSSGIYVVGYTGGTLPGQNKVSGTDAYIRKYAADGTELWTRQFGTYGTHVATAVTVDPTGVYVAGYTDGVFPGWTNGGATDAFVVKFDLNGEQSWAAQLGTASMDYAYGSAADGCGGVSITGTTWGDWAGVNQGQADAFLVRLDSQSAAVLWTRQFGTPEWDTALAVAADRPGST